MSNPYAATYRLGQFVPVRVERVLRYGVFVRLPDGSAGYIRRRELTNSGNVDPRGVVAPGQVVTAVVIALPAPDLSIELSVRRAEQDPWDTFAQSFKVTDTVTAVVKSLSPWGAFVQIVPGVDGLIPLAELAPWEALRPEDVLWIGDQVEATITRVSRSARRVQLSIRQQMEHESRVRKVMQMVQEDQPVEELVEEDRTSVRADEEVEGIDTVAAQSVGWILVVDDEDAVREPLVGWLQRQGFAAQGAASIQEALSCFDDRPFGLALIDLDLFSEDGLQLIRRLAAQAPDTKIAVISTPEKIIERIEDLQALNVLYVFVKPFDLEEVRETILQLDQGTLPTLPQSLAIEQSGDVAEISFRQLAGSMRSGQPLWLRFQKALEDLVRATRAEQGLVFCIAPDSRQVSIIASAGDIPLNQEALYALVGSPVENAIREGTEVFETCVSRVATRRFAKLLDLLPFESCVGVPVWAQGEVQHAIFLFHRQPNALSRYRLRDAWATAMLLSVALESQAMERRIQAASPFVLGGQLASAFSHEVYNKMSGLEIQMQNLQADLGAMCQGGASGRQEAPLDLEHCSAAADQLLDLTRDLKATVELFRELSRAEQSEEIDVNETIRRAMGLLRTDARRNRISVRTELLPTLPQIRGSATRLQQVFANLILNAIQQTTMKMERWHRGQGVLQITSTWEPTATRPIQVRFVDNGPGIHRQQWESIFALGFSTRPGGTGLGLFIARGLAEAMGGQVVVERSIVPQGTIFRVELPGA